MALSIGQTIPLTQADNVASKAVSFGTAPAAGSLLVVMIATYDNSGGDAHGITSVTDNQGNTYTRAVEIINPGSGQHEWSTIFYAKNIASSGTFTITLTGANGSSNYYSFGVVEVIGADTTAPLDQTSTNTGTSTTPTAIGITTTVANEYVASAISLAANATSITVPTGYTSRFSEPADSPHQAGAGAEKIRTTTGTETPVWTVGASVQWTVAMASFKAAVATAKLKRPAADLSGLGSPGPFFHDPLGG